jgi:hypothetical protein
MRANWMQAASAIVGIVALGGAMAVAQESPAGQPQTGARAKTQALAVSGSQIDVGVSFYNAFTDGSSGYGTEQTPKNAVGGMIEARYLQSPFFGFEITYAHNSADQSYAPTATNCGFTCANPPTKLTAKADEIGLDWVLSKKIGNLRPFAVGGAGFFITTPSRSTYEVDTVVRPVFIYGGGVDWAFVPHLGVRAQFRDNLYKAPNMSALYPTTGQFTHSSEPMGGVYYRF